MDRNWKIAILLIVGILLGCIGFLSYVFFFYGQPSITDEGYIPDTLRGFE